MQIKGRWHPTGSAKAYEATLFQEGEKRYRLQVDGAVDLEGEIHTLKIPQRLGNTERKITVGNGSLFVTSDNDAIDKILKEKSKRHTLVHTLETHLHWVLVSIVLTVIIAFGFFKWGIPWSAKKIAHALPYETNRLISGETMTFLNKHLFSESNLSMEKQQEIREHFRKKLAPVSRDKEIVYTLHFKKWGDIPNALALPSGDIILTDRFVELAESQDQIDAVLLHEMGHVVHRHGLEMVIESTFISVAVMLIVGDSSALADLGVGMGSFLVTSSYTRGHETEADIYAFDQMLQLGIDPKAFTHIMEKITKYEEDLNKTKDPQETKHEEEESWLDYFSSHPATAKRTEIADIYSECFRQGLKTCDVKLQK